LCAIGDVETANSLIKKLQEEAAELRLLMKKAEREKSYSKEEIIEERALDQMAKMLQVDRIAYGEQQYRYRVKEGKHVELRARPDHSAGTQETPSRETPSQVLIASWRRCCRERRRTLGR
jgi:hypothetical protein